LAVGVDGLAVLAFRAGGIGSTISEWNRSLIWNKESKHHA